MRLMKTGLRAQGLNIRISEINRITESDFQGHFKKIKFYQAKIKDKKGKRDTLPFVSTVLICSRKKNVLSWASIIYVKGHLAVDQGADGGQS